MEEKKQCGKLATEEIMKRGELGVKVGLVCWGRSCGNRKLGLKRGPVRQRAAKKFHHQCLHNQEIEEFTLAAGDQSLSQEFRRFRI